MTLFLLISLAYLLGSIPFGLLLVRAFRHEDVRKSGSGNIGATNVMRAGGKKLGAITLLLDMAKGFAAVTVANIVVHHQTGDRTAIQNTLAAAALAAVLGHVFPLWLSFRGGKGVATAVGVFLAIAPQAALISVLVFVAVVVLSRYVSVASIVGALAFAGADLLLLGSRQSTFLKLVVVAIALLIIAKHHKNIVRLLQGTESRFGKSKAAAA